MDLFDYMRETAKEKESPLASRMRPTTLEEVVGQQHIIGKGKLLYRAIKADKLSSLIFYGPPGTGKTTLAKVIANTTSAEFKQINATVAGKKDMEEVVRAAKDLQGMYGKKTILFIDEIHRFNKGQQDYLLPFVEDGTLILIGATTENPYFEVNGALISRSSIFELKPLEKEDIKKLLVRAVEDTEKGMGSFHAQIDPDALEFLADVSGGDARNALNAVELGILTTDRSIADLLEVLDKKVGLQNVLIFVTSTGYIDSESPDSGLYKVPGGEFYLNRCAALLNMYLMATYGEGKYVEAHHNQQIYLNHKLLEKKELNLAEIQQKSAEFLMQFSGVNEAYSANRLLLGSWTPEIYKIRNGYHRKRSGDLVIDVLPGWTIVNENGGDNKVVRHSYIPSPLIFMGHSVKPAIIQTPVTIEHIAPTLAHFMRIRAPNACTSAPITDLR